MVDGAFSYLFFNLGGGSYIRTHLVTPLSSVESAVLPHVIVHITCVGSPRIAILAYCRFPFSFDDIFS